VTYSIVARAADGRSWGVAVASKYLAAGSAVPALEAGAGALATQAWVNVGYRPQGLALLRAGLSAHEVVAALTAADEGRAVRQLGVVDAEGRAASFTGPECSAWAGGRAGDGYAVQGNILAGPEVLDAMEAAWSDSGSDGGSDSGPDGGQLALARRLFAALAAGDAAGGDRRGRQAAALVVVGLDDGIGAGHRRGQGADLLVDLRVDDHQDPVAELGRLLDLAELYFGKPDPATLLPLEGELADEVARRLAALGHASLEDWAGIENYEERLVEGAIDPVVLGKLREATA
jgi:uncharacterized Ntn-hydrolase superfamily protein